MHFVGHNRKRFIPNDQRWGFPSVKCLCTIEHGGHAWLSRVMVLCLSLSPILRSLNVLLIVRGEFHTAFLQHTVIKSEARHISQ